MQNLLLKFGADPTDAQLYVNMNDKVFAEAGGQIPRGNPTHRQEPAYTPCGGGFGRCGSRGGQACTPSVCSIVRPAAQVRHPQNPSECPHIVPSIAWPLSGHRWKY